MATQLRIGVENPELQAIVREERQRVPERWDEPRLGPTDTVITPGRPTQECELRLDGGRFEAPSPAEQLAASRGDDQLLWGHASPDHTAGQLVSKAVQSL